MGIYSKYILPPLLDLTLRNREQRRLRAKWVPRARGEVLEVGIGSGLNLPFYTKQVKRVWGVDSSPELLRLARQRAMNLHFPINFDQQSAEHRLELADNSIDTAVVTWVLCSMDSPARALQELRRVLKAHGELIFVEHGRSPDAGIARWQDRLTPAWKRIAGGCTLNRPMSDLIRKSGFDIRELTTGYIPGPRPLTYMYEGCAQPA